MCWAPSDCTGTTLRGAILAKGRRHGRIWVYVRDDKPPFGGRLRGGKCFCYSRDHADERPRAHMAVYSGILQTDAYGRYGKLCIRAATRVRSSKPHAGSMLRGRSS
ncbi:IS66 family transposase [Bradyrhizobium mercantei]|uniref:IS66 family transposase n=1 Tax=Bradyrhizobium mercantei TaxID=1904807 RepID=UPI000975B43D|nr:transposase [Bradyrhizobium mercantei]